MNSFWYSPTTDIAAIIEGNKVYKYIGPDSLYYDTFKSIFGHPLDKWYTAKVRPTRKKGFILIMRWK